MKRIYLRLLRDFYAGLALHALLSNPERYKYISKKVDEGMSNEEATDKNCNKAVLMANQLVDRLNKN